MTTQYIVRLRPTGEAFEVAAAETILAAALRSGISLPFCCRARSCGRCVATVPDGRAFQNGEQVATLHEREICLCMATLASDVEIRLHARGAASHPRQFPATVVGLPEPPGAAFVLRVPPSIWRGLDGGIRLMLLAPAALVGPLKSELRRLRNPAAS